MLEIIKNQRSEYYIVNNKDASVCERFAASELEKYLYLSTTAEGFENKYLFDMWVTTIIFTCLICVCAIGLAIFGFLLFKNSDGSGL